jgi:glutamine amidotransferase
LSFSSRYATQGAVALENVHPFSRELWGIQWSFAHNGEVPLFTNVAAVDTSASYSAVGDTGT